MPKEATVTSNSLDPDYDLLLGIEAPETPGVTLTPEQDISNLVSGVFAVGTDFSKKSKTEVLDPPEDLKIPEGAVGEEEGEPETEEEPLDLGSVPLLGEEEEAEPPETPAVPVAPNDLYLNFLTGTLAASMKPGQTAPQAAPNAPETPAPVAPPEDPFANLSSFMTDEELLAAGLDPTPETRRFLDKFGSRIGTAAALHANKNFEEQAVYERMNTYLAQQFYAGNQDIVAFVTDPTTKQAIPERAQLINLAATHIRQIEPGLGLPELYQKLPQVVRAMAGIAAPVAASTPVTAPVQRRAPVPPARRVAQARATSSRRPRGGGKLSEEEQLFRETKILKNLS